MPALNTDLLLRVGKPGSATNLGAPGHTIGGTSITVGSTTNWPTDTAVAFAIDRAELVGGQEQQIAGSYTEWIGTVAGPTTINNLVISGDSPNSDQNYSAGSLTRVYIPVSATRENKLVEWGLTHADQDGTLKADAVDVTAVIKDAVITPQKLNSRTRLGWIDNELSAVSTVTHNGNRSYDVVFASTVASILSEGMRLEFTKTVAGNAYMGGAFNGSSHYFTKTSPSGTLGTVTNNITIETNYQLDTYPASRKYIGGRADSTPNNGFGLAIEPSGQVLYAIFNGGTGNSRVVTTYQSLPLNKKTHIAVSHTGATILIYFDGVAVPTATTTAGTAPITAGTGGDFSIGRFGAWNSAYSSGYVSNFAVFDAVLSASTIKDHYTKKLTGSETNCIGAWSLDNTPNDQSSAGNNLTATGGVGYTAISPHGQLGNGVETTKAVGLVMAVSGSTVTVQCPEGVTIPTTGGITSVAYGIGNPFGWVDDKGRWEIVTTNRSLSFFTPVSGTWYNHQSLQIYIPKGSWSLGWSGVIRGGYNSAGANYIQVFAGLSKSSASAPTGAEFETMCASALDAAAGPSITTQSVKSRDVKIIETGAAWYLNYNAQSGGTFYPNQCGYHTSLSPTTIAALPSGL